MLSFLLSLPWIQYILINVTGFSIFTIIWTYVLPKPKPMDYTTIPGLKLDVNSEDDLPSWSLEPGKLVTEAAKDAKLEKIKNGHIPKMDEAGSFLRFLDKNETMFGPLHSFWWSVRYVVVVSSRDGLQQLQKYVDSMLALNPLATGSVLQGDPNFWTRVPASSIVTTRSEHNRPSLWLDPALQMTFVERGPFRDECAATKPESEQEQLKRVVPQLIASIRSDGLKAVLLSPLVVSFNREIELQAMSGAHPIPAFIPIILHNAALLRDTDPKHVLDEYCNLMRWLPGMDDVDVIKALAAEVKPMTK